LRTLLALAAETVTAMKYDPIGVVVVLGVLVAVLPPPLQPVISNSRADEATTISTSKPFSTSFLLIRSVKPSGNSSKANNDLVACLPINGFSNAAVVDVETLRVVDSAVSVPPGCTWR
jgi:hypothetical protein